MNNFSSIISLSKGLNKIAMHPDYRFVRNFGIVVLDSRAELSYKTEDSEYGLLWLQGKCNLSVDEKTLGTIESRENVFSGLPVAAYIPPDSSFTLSGGSAQIAVFGGACTSKKYPSIIKPDDIRIMQVGQDNWKREVRIIIGPDGPSENIILGETINPPGNWSGTPPHRHENYNLSEGESLHEEIYYFRSDKPEGWGMQRIYSPERGVNELLYLQNNSVTFMPWGYHQVVAAPGYTLYYTFFLAGKGKQLTGYDDPEHSWIKDRQGA